MLFVKGKSEVLCLGNVGNDKKTPNLALEMIIFSDELSVTNEIVISLILGLVLLRAREYFFQVLMEVASLIDW